MRYYLAWPDRETGVLMVLGASIGRPRTTLFGDTEWNPAIDQEVAEWQTEDELRATPEGREALERYHAEDDRAYHDYCRRADEEDLESQRRSERLSDDEVRAKALKMLRRDPEVLRSKSDDEIAAMADRIVEWDRHAIAKNREIDADIFFQNHPELLDLPSE